MLRHQHNDLQWLPEHSLVEIFPEVLSHKSEGTEEGPAKCVEICVPVIWILSEPLSNKSYREGPKKKGVWNFEELEVGGADDRCLEADVILRTGTSPTGVATQLVVLHLCPPVPVCVVVVELHPRLMALPPSPVGLFVG